MTALHHYALLCDHGRTVSDGARCGATFNCGSKRADETRAAASPLGWVWGVIPPNPNKGGPAKTIDLCPAHAHAMPVEARHKALPMHARPL